MSWGPSLSARHRTRRWVARSAGPVPYWPGTRLMDAMAGWRDGRQELPAVTDPPHPDGVPATHRLAEVRGYARGRIAAERLATTSQG